MGYFDRQRKAERRYGCSRFELLLSEIPLNCMCDDGSELVRWCYGGFFRSVDQPAAPLWGRARNEASVPPAYRHDLANIGLNGYALRLWGSASFSMAGFMHTSTLMRRIVPLGICPNETICYSV